MGSSPNVDVPMPQLHPVIEPEPGEPEIKPKKEKLPCSSRISLTRHYFEDLIPTMTTESLDAQSKGPKDCDNVQHHVEPSLPMTEEVPYSAAWIQRSYSLFDLVSVVSQEFACLLLQANLALACFSSPSVECPFPEIHALSW
jgi:hypothetical protein